MRREFDPERLRNCLEITEKAALQGLWDQKEWVAQFDCGTGGCLAGNYALSQGCVPALEWHAASSYEATACVITTLDGRRESVATWARNDLGLTVEEADMLFAGTTNTLTELREIVEEIIAGRGM